MAIGRIATRVAEIGLKGGSISVEQAIKAGFRFLGKNKKGLDVYIKKSMSTPKGVQQPYYGTNYLYANNGQIIWERPIARFSHLDLEHGGRRLHSGYSIGEECNPLNYKAVYVDDFGKSLGYSRVSSHSRKWDKNSSDYNEFIEAEIGRDSRINNVRINLYSTDRSTGWEVGSDHEYRINFNPVWMTTGGIQRGTPGGTVTTSTQCALTGNHSDTRSFILTPEQLKNNIYTSVSEAFKNLSRIFGIS